jgi:NDP-sugar pyrophosphorylase family protein
MAASLPGSRPLAAVVLAAGAGTRLRPLTDLRPKALCPVANVPLVDLTLDRVASLTGDVAVNIHHGRPLMEAHLRGRVHLSIEEPEALGTAGALGRLREWIAGRPALVVNVDAWHRLDLAAFARDWDEERVRLLTVDRSFGPGARVVATLMPWAGVAALQPHVSSLYERCWRPASESGRLEVVSADGVFFDCGTPAGYLGANMAASGGGSVVGPGAVVEGELDRSVVWPGAVVGAGERLSRAIRGGEQTTVLVR